MSTNELNPSSTIIVPLTSSVQERIAAPDRIHVQISEPQLVSYGLPYLPVMWGVLKTYWELHAPSPRMVHWHPPIHEMVDPERLVEPLGDQPIDVLGLSCYTWNWRLQREIARLIKRSHPHCLIVAGGPQPDYRDPKFFDENPFIDAVVVKDGEVPFTRILHRVLSFPTMNDFRAAGAPLDDIPGLCLPNRGGMLTAPSVVPDEYSTSSYLAQREYYEGFIHEQRRFGGVVAAWETSRGCPFRCSYCDWGSSTMSKVRRFDMERLRAEIEWFASSGVRVVFSVDSNFGMFKSDVDLTDEIVRAKARFGNPAYFVYSNAKNVPDRTIEITRKVVGAGLDTAHTLSIQHSSLDVLEATDRKNISVDKQIKVVRELQSDGVPISAQLILGLPLDTPALWRATFTDLMEWGIHDGYIVTNYHLLPNAPAAAPEYREKWTLKTVDRYIYDGPGARDDDPIDPLTYARGEVIVSTSSFTRPDWITMSTEAALLKALHNGGLTQSIARYLRCTHAIPYHAFYSDLIDSFLPGLGAMRAIVETLTRCYERFLEDEEYLALVPMPGVGETRRHVEPHRWCFASIAQRADEFYDELAAHLITAYPGVTRLQSLCDYQRRILVLPSYDRAAGSIAPIEHDWVGYFQRGDSRIPEAPAREPRTLIDSILVIEGKGWDDKTGRGGYNWPVGTHPDAWRVWFETMATNRMSANKCNHQAIRIDARALSAQAG